MISAPERVFSLHDDTFWGKRAYHFRSRSQQKHPNLANLTDLGVKNTLCHFSV